MDTGLNSRLGAQALIQPSVFTNVEKKDIFSESSSEVGYVVVEDAVLAGERSKHCSEEVVELKRDFVSVHASGIWKGCFNGSGTGRPEAQLLNEVHD